MWPWTVYISGLWYHYGSGSFYLAAWYIATVYPYLFYNFGSWCHSFGISFLTIAKIIATVLPFSSYSSDLWPSMFGMIPKQAWSNIVISLSCQCYGTGKSVFSKRYFKDYVKIFYMFTSCISSFGGTYYKKCTIYIAVVIKFLSDDSGLLYQYFGGIIP